MGKLIGKEKDKEFNKLIKDMLSLSKVSAIISSAYQYKITENTVESKTSNEENVIIYGINDINPKVMNNKKKFETINQSKNDLLENYKTSLEKLGKNYDNIITMGYIKLLDEELEQLEKYIDIYNLKKQENKAKEKLDNSDDQIAEEIYKIEDELEKSESRTRRIKTTINAKIKEKKELLMNAMESSEKQMQTAIKGTHIFKGAKKFFIGKLNPQKAIEKNVFSTIRERIEKFNNEDLVTMKKSTKYTKANLIASVDSTIAKKSKKILSNCN